MQIHQTFATAGSDGAYNFWDKDSKQRLKVISSVILNLFMTGKASHRFAFAKQNYFYSSQKQCLHKICAGFHESNRVLKYFIESNSNGDKINMSSLPWLLTEKQSDALKKPNF